MKNFAEYLLWVALLALLPLVSCGNDANEGMLPDEFNVGFELPGSVDVDEGGECSFTVANGEAPRMSDSFLLESGEGVSYICPFVSVSAERFTVHVPEECATGYYKVYIKRDVRKKPFGTVWLHVVDELGFTPDAGVTVYGKVSSEEGALPGVVVSDGTEVAVTDEDGIYQLRSAKKWGYVFLSIPSGYEVASDGVLPLFFQMLKSDAGTAERADFKLTRTDGQERYKVFMLGDMHLADRTEDLKQFRDFTEDLEEYRRLHAGEKMYAIALGDMTWDLYWYSRNYALPDYLKTINSQVRGLQIFHTIGNHDNDYKATSDFDAETKYRDYIAPTYYSFNIGKVHYVVLDDIDCSRYDGTTSRRYEKRISNEQLEWLSKDLAYVDKSTPLVVVMHAQVFYPSEEGGFQIDHDVANTTSLFNILDGYRVHFVTGHTHLNFNVTPDEAITAGHDFYEHNTGAICASWWWSGHLTPGIHISLDGTPGGYAVWDVSGTDLQWIYKATGRPEEYQFRTYDLNNVHFSTADVPQMPADVPASVREVYMQYVDAYPERHDNEVLINIWNWNPRWTLTVTDEAGNRLVPEAVWAYDPLHIAALSVKRFNSATLTSVPSFVTEKFTHFFKVQAPDADADLQITVTDEFGHTWTERMERPKEFSTEAYR